MSLKLKYTIYILLIHAGLASLVFYVLREHKLYFFLAEASIIISLSIAYLLFRNFIQPIEFIKEGQNAIVDKDFTIKYVPTGSSEMDKLISVYNNMINNIRHERIQVQEQHYFLQKLINASPNGIIILDYEDRITDLNPRAIELLKIDQIWQNQTITNFDNPILNEISKLESNTSKVISIRGVENYKCETSSFIHRGFKRKFILIQELSKEILAAEKRAYGKVIRMMAHEVNNSIGAINSILHSVVEIENERWSESKSKNSLLRELGENKADETVVNALTVAINRNDNLNQFMRNFADVIRIPQPNFEQIDLNVLLKNTATLMETQAKNNQIHFNFQFYPNPVFVHADLRLMEQVLVNLIKNSMEAFENVAPKNDFSTIKFTTFQNGFSISDNGSGIAPEIADKLFTPFFSTKATGQGVGLTLIREILLNHKAVFSLKTGGDGWTVFEVRWVS
jgi:nitrogen fixation/metabolism regulation signal transduction histidine kinase